MEHPRYHEIVSPIREVVRGIGTWALDKILPADVISDVFNGIQRESAERTVQMFTQDRKREIAERMVQTFTQDRLFED